MSMQTADNLVSDMLPKDNDVHMEDDEIAQIKARVKEIEEEAEKLRKIQSTNPQEPSPSNTGQQQQQTLSPHYVPNTESSEIDARSIYVGNVDYSTTAQELEAHFHGCGAVNRVTILCDKFSGNPKGFAYIEFADAECAATAIALDDSVFKNRQIKVMQKRTNRPGISTTDRHHRAFRRGRGGRFGYSGYRSRYPYPRPYYSRGRYCHYYSPY
ncbi:hypothetical protein GJ496_009174 [Pomphorhynchus laevis]|nr:hypothetical protein GJ496_009174 [Pomphorhynchus laevis]